PCNQVHEICESVSGQSRLSEMRVGRKKILRSGMQVGEIAASAAGDQDLLADPRGAFKNNDAAATFTGFDGTHEAGRSGPQYDGIVSLIHASISLSGWMNTNSSRAGQAMSERRERDWTQLLSACSAYI